MIATRTPGPSHDWFAQARFGLLIHWGVYSLYGRGEGVLLHEHLSALAYRERSREFAPARYDPRSWAELSVEAGVRYAVLTAKHHDGFCLFDSAHSDWTATQGGAGRDLLAGYVEAFRAAGLYVGLYYSLANWTSPAYLEGPLGDPAGFLRLVDTAHQQVDELCRHYGRIDLLWLDGLGPYTPRQWRLADLERAIRAQQPDILLTGPPEVPGDVLTLAQGRRGEGASPLCQVCMPSVERHWGYHVGERVFKSPGEVIRQLAGAAESDSNLLLCVGPRDDGTLPAPAVDLLREVGTWLSANGRAVYGCSPGVCDSASFGHMAVSGETVYLHVLYWPGNTLHLAGLASRVRQARFLADEWPIRFEQEGDHLFLRGLPARPPDPRDTVIAIDVAGMPTAAPWVARRL